MISREWAYFPGCLVGRVLVKQVMQCASLGDFQRTIRIALWGHGAAEWTKYKRILCRRLGLPQAFALLRFVPSVKIGKLALWDFLAGAELHSRFNFFHE